MSLPASAKWSASVVALFVLALAGFFLKDTYARFTDEHRDHELRLKAGEVTIAVTALQLSLMQRQLDRMESKLDTIVTARRPK